MADQTIIQLTAEQEQAFALIHETISGSGKPYCTIGGYAGTGKTTIISFLAGHTERKIAYATYTGKAYLVLREKLRVMAANFDEIPYIGTLHGLLYHPIQDPKTGRLLGWGARDADGGGERIDAIVVDEASMVPKKIFDDLMAIGVPIVFVGDHGQLPPVEGTFNIMAKPDVRLEKIHRQAEGNPIIKISMIAREEGKIPYGTFGDNNEVLKTPNHNLIKGTSFWERQVKEGMHNLLMICNMNWTRSRWNATIRDRLGLPKNTPAVGDQVICLINDWKFDICNGLSGIITESHETPFEKDHAYVYTDGSGAKQEVKLGTWFKVAVMFDNNVKWIGYAFRKQFGFGGKQVIMHDDYSLITHRIKNLKKRFQESGKQQPPLPSPFTLIDYGYCITAHKSQGSEAKKVIVLEERNKYQSDEQWRRWLYTAVTRAKERLMVIG